MIRLRHAVLVLLIVIAVLTGLGYRNATADPIVRHTAIAATDWPAGTPPLRVALMSDLHVAGPDMPPQRLARIVAQVNALRPDIVLIAGDMVSDRRIATRHYTTAEAVAPLRGLRARLGTIAVLGNHDHWRDPAPFRQALAAAGVQLLTNEAFRRGPLAIGGIDDAFTGNADLDTTFAALDALGGARIVLSHSPDVVPLLPHRVDVVLAGHTHCGQIILPLIGRIATASRYGERFACGRIEDRGQTVIVTAGLGTSIVPLRYGARPDLWLITIGPKGRR